MNKTLLLIMLTTLLWACKKTDFSPEGPTDIRIRNLSEIVFTEVIVNTSGGIDTISFISPGSVSEYSRFEKAFPKAEISAKIEGVVFSTGPVDYTYMQYLSTIKATYDVFIENYALKKLAINDVKLDSPLK
jgi:hypothetical protein